MNVSKPSWTEPYMDSTEMKTGLGLMTTAAIPVYDRSKTPIILLGVVGIDILMQDLYNLADEKTGVLQIISDKSNPVCGLNNISSCQFNSLRPDPWYCFSTESYPCLQTLASTCQRDLKNVFCNVNEDMYTSYYPPDTCCGETATRCIVGFSVGFGSAGVVGIALAAYFLMKKKMQQDELEQEGRQNDNERDERGERRLDTETNEQREQREQREARRDRELRQVRGEVEIQDSNRGYVEGRVETIGIVGTVGVDGRVITEERVHGGVDTRVHGGVDTRVGGRVGGGIGIGVSSGVDTRVGGGIGLGLSGGISSGVDTRVGGGIGYSGGISSGVDTRVGGGIGYSGGISSGVDTRVGGGIGLEIGGGVDTRTGGGFGLEIGGGVDTRTGGGVGIDGGIGGGIGLGIGGGLGLNLNLGGGVEEHHHGHGGGGGGLHFGIQL